MGKSAQREETSCTKCHNCAGSKSEWAPESAYIFTHVDPHLSTMVYLHGQHSAYTSTWQKEPLPRDSLRNTADEWLKKKRKRRRKKWKEGRSELGEKAAMKILCLADAMPDHWHQPPWLLSVLHNMKITNSILKMKKLRFVGSWIGFLRSQSPWEATELKSNLVLSGSKPAAS